MTAHLRHLGRPLVPGCPDCDRQQAQLGRPATVTDETRAQAEDAVRVLDAVIARDRAYEARQARRYADAPPDDESRRLLIAWLDATDHALHQMTMYRARYGHTR